MAGSSASRSASLRSSYPAKRPNTDWRNWPCRVWRPFAPVRVSVRTSPATLLRPRTSSSSRQASSPPSDVILDLRRRSNVRPKAASCISPTATSIRGTHHQPYAADDLTKIDACGQCKTQPSGICGLRTVRRLVDDALAALDRTFADLYAAFGRRSIPPERLLRAMLLQAFYSIRSERLLMERLDHDFLFRWFVGLGIDDPVWDPSTFSKNRDRLLEGDIAARFLTAILALPRVKRLLSHEHFSVDGTLIEAWASMKSFKPKDSPNPDEKDPPQRRNPEVNFRGERRSNETHASTTDPDARLYRKGDGMEAKLCFMGHALMENRNGLIVDACVTQADGHAERIAALAMIEPLADRPNRITLGADKAFDTQDFVNELRTMNVTPHVAQNTAGRRSAIDGRVTRHQSYALSQKLRKRIEEAFGWAKEISGLGRTRFRGRERVGLAFGFAAVAYNLVRLPRLLGAGA